VCFAINKGTCHVLNSIFSVSESGFALKEVKTFQGARSCSRIIYSDGYLIIKDVSSSNSKNFVKRLYII
jgi:hypothetical protein